MFGIGTGELLVILAIGLFLFGSQLPRMARSLGGSVAAFRREANNLEEDVRVPVR